MMQQEVTPRDTVTRQQVLDYYRSKAPELGQVPDDDLLGQIGKSNPTIIRHLVDAGDADASKFYPTTAQINQTVSQRPETIRRVIPGGKELMSGYAPGPQGDPMALLAGRQAPAARVMTPTAPPLAAPAAPAPKLGPAAPPQTGMGEVKLAEQKPPVAAAPVGMGDVKSAEAGIKPPVAPAAVGMGDVKAVERPQAAPAQPPAAPAPAPAAVAAKPAPAPPVTASAPKPSTSVAPSTREPVVPAGGWNSDTETSEPPAAPAPVPDTAQMGLDMTMPAPPVAPAAAPAAPAPAQPFQQDLDSIRGILAGSQKRADEVGNLQRDAADPTKKAKSSLGRKIAGAALGVGATMLTGNPLAGFGAYNVLAGAPERERQANIKGQITAAQTHSAADKETLGGYNTLVDAENAQLGHQVTAEGNKAQQAQAAATLAETTRNHDILGAAAAAKLLLAQQKAGLDENNNPLPEDQLSAQARAELADKKSLAEFRTAGIELRRAELAAKGDRNNPQYQLALLRYQQAQRRLDQTDRMLDIRQESNDSAIFGRGPDGQPINGAMVINGQPVGSRFSNNVRPTNLERNRADLAKSGLEQAADMHDILDRHPEIFGPVEGRLTDVDTWLGSQSPDAAKFAAALETLSGHLAATFGNSSLPAIQGLKDVLGRYKENPEALATALTQVEKSAKTIYERGVMNTVGSKEGNAQLKNGAAPAPVAPASLAAPTPAGTRPGYTMMKNPKGEPHWVKNEQVQNAPVGWTK